MLSFLCHDNIHVAFLHALMQALWQSLKINDAVDRRHRGITLTAKPLRYVLHPHVLLTAFSENYQ